MSALEIELVSPASGLGGVEMDLCLYACILFVLITIIKFPLINKLSLAETEISAKPLK